MDGFSTGLRADVCGDRIARVTLRCDLYLYQFVKIQRLFDLRHHALFEAMLAHPDDRLQVVAEATQVAFLGFGQFHRRARKKGRQL